MDLTEMTFDGARPFDGYGPGFFRVGGEVVEGAIVLHSGGMARWEGYADMTALTRLADVVDFVLVGTGAEITHVPADLRQAVENAGLGFEVMNTPAACRTYNVLVGEGRRVAAAVLSVERS
ncbi:Mth938-like domain-containing protein [Jannaschia rubra]|uniref:Mth938-like domain-containing protein n=1 Tax=Jannaschia rubra TaxID=282197 RepID=UPI0024937C1D|nr:Mth938-like domain-containing protein [Jannaschia rubra]